VVNNLMGLFLVLNGLFYLSISFKIKKDADNKGIKGIIGVLSAFFISLQWSSGYYSTLAVICIVVLFSIPFFVFILLYRTSYKTTVLWVRIFAVISFLIGVTYILLEYLGRN
jgi:hypothetical protein